MYLTQTNSHINSTSPQKCTFLYISGKIQNIHPITTAIQPLMSITSAFSELKVYFFYTLGVSDWHSFENAVCIVKAVDMKSSEPHLSSFWFTSQRKTADLTLRIEKKVSPLSIILLSKETEVCSSVLITSNHLHISFHDLSLVVLGLWNTWNIYLTEV